ncbi:MAG TPA: arylsulfotransferase family protein [Solirubrobacteraceae bacterium]|nr:arylsulfotransferase family protein [Solirubrobacteraceae bacterium]
MHAARRLALASATFLLGAAGAPAAASAQRLSVSPQPGTPDASAYTQVSFLGARARQFGRIVVTGSVSGRHPGKLYPYAAAAGGSFVPDRPFAAGERVRVRMQARANLPALDYRFTIARPGPINATLPPCPPSRPRGGDCNPPTPPAPPQSPLTFRSRPDLMPPQLTVTANLPGAAAGDLFVAPFAAAALPLQHGPAIFDGQGNLVWFDPIPGRAGVANFRAQTVFGKPVLTWWQGQLIIPYPGMGLGQGVILDSSYRQIGAVIAGNGYQADLHDLVVTPQGTAWVTVYPPVLWNLQALGGAPQASTLDGVVQEIDIRTGLVMFEWHTFGHIPLLDTNVAPVANIVYDPFHVNSVQVSGPHSVLVSMRNTWAIYDVSTQTGKILWTLGGDHSSYKLASGAVFSWQHDAQLHSGGLVSLFDDESFGQTASVPSRGLVLKLDNRDRSATVVHQYLHIPPTFGRQGQGNLQTLGNGDAFVGWGADAGSTTEPYVAMSEFTAQGQLLFDAQFKRPVESYRALRQAWTGTPAAPPDVAAQSTGAGQTTVYASWNGATQVARWQVLAGSDAGHLASAGAPAPRTGFETAIAVPSAGPFFEVQALDAAGRILGTSRPVQAH